MIKNRQGVNLGGWLVLERWITPSLFQGSSAGDEYTLCQDLSTEEVAKRLTEHRETFITQEHFKRISDFGLSLVRLPVGYWLFGDQEPYVDGADVFVKKAFEWAEQYGLEIIVDFHAAPGSQNGWDHSGRSGTISWPEPHNVEASLGFIEQLTTRYGAEVSLAGIEPLNEPHWDISLTTLVKYYRQAADIIRRNCHDQVSVIVSDAFRPKEMSKALRRAKLDAVLDVHLYQLFTPEDRALDLQGHIKKTNKQWHKLLNGLSKHHDILVGEWSAAMSELYNETGERQLSNTNADYRRYVKTQLDVFSGSSASWTYWTARTQDGGVWSLLDHPEFLN